MLHFGIHLLTPFIIAALGNSNPVFCRFLFAGNKKETVKNADNYRYDSMVYILVKYGHTCSVLFSPQK
jgi:hypothetical protein